MIQAFFSIFNIVYGLLQFQCTFCKGTDISLNQNLETPKVRTSTLEKMLARPFLLILRMENFDVSNVIQNLRRSHGDKDEFLSRKSLKLYMGVLGALISILSLLILRTYLIFPGFVQRTTTAGTRKKRTTRSEGEDGLYSNSKGCHLF